MAKERIAKWDNAKAILIFLVVLGHFCQFFCEHSEIYRSLFMFIYTFHMPVFIFISGIFSKSFMKKEKFDISKILPFLILAITLNFYRFLSVYIFDKSADFNLFDLGNISWFLFAIAVFYAVTYVLRRVNPKYVLLFSVVAACIAGYDSNLGSFLSLSRIIVFYPFFHLGYCLDGEKINGFLNKKSVRCISAVVMLAFALICIFWIKKVYLLRPLITGLNPFDEIKIRSSFDGLFRLLYYVAVVIIGGAFLSIVPKTHLRGLSFVGTRTISVYFWHLPIIEIVFRLGVLEFLSDLSPAIVIPIMIISAVLLTLILSLKPFVFLVDLAMKPKLIEKNK